MSAGTLIRNHVMPDADLIQYAFFLVGYLTRDADQFLPYGLSPQDISALHTLATSLSDYPDDLVYLADVGIANEDKNAKAEELYNSIKSIIIRAENKFGLNSVQYKRFGVSGLARLNDRDLYVCAKRVHHVASDFLNELTDVGLNQNILDNFLALTGEFESTLFRLNDANYIREKSTGERIALVNNLYSYVVKYTNFGKLIYENSSEAKYNDYIIYSATPAGKLNAPENLTYDYSTKTVSWTKDLNATSYFLQSSVNEKDFNKIYSGTENTYTFKTAFPVKTYLRCRCRNANGYGPFSTILEVD